MLIPLYLFKDGMQPVLLIAILPVTKHQIHFFSKGKVSPFFLQSHLAQARFSGFTSTSGNFWSLSHPKVCGVPYLRIAILTTTTSVVGAHSYFINTAHIVMS
jgi:hypothetical protein